MIRKIHYFIMTMSLKFYLLYVKEKFILCYGRSAFINVILINFRKSGVK